MANSRYGTVRLSNISPSDVEIFYTYTPNRETLPDYNLNKLEPATSYLAPYYTQPNGTELFGGLYNLTLPSNVFNKLGIYNIVIRPKQIRTKIVDCGSLTALPGEKGLIIDITGSVDNSGNQVDINNLVNTLTGYRIEYLDTVSGNLVSKQNYFTIITSANKCEVVSSNVSNVTQKATTYRLTDAGKLLFFTVSPNTVSPVKPNQKPFIGEPGQNIILTNTNFNPISIEVELTNYDIDAIGRGLYGYMIRNIASGEVTWYNDDLSIYKQALLYRIKDEFGNPLYEIKELKQQIDPSQDWNIITSDVQNG